MLINARTYVGNLTYKKIEEKNVLEQLGSMERQIPYILHQSHFFSSHTHLSYDLLMYYCICVIMLDRYIYINQTPTN